MNEQKDPLEGKKLNGRYVILRRVSSGETGSVYQAELISTGAKVAVKLLDKRLTQGPDASAKLQTHVRTLAGMSHPGIAAPLDFGSTGDGGYYIVTSWVDGVSLRQAIEKKKRFDKGEFSDIAEQVLDILGFAHGKKNHHLFLNADNIILQALGGPGSVRLINFGLKQILSGAEVKPVPKDKDTAAAEHFWYVSPEQVKGDTALVGEASDLYSAGAIFHHMLSGKPPFNAGSAWETLHEIANQTPPSIRKTNGSIPWQLEKGVERMMEKTPFKRPKSAAMAIKGVVRPDTAGEGDKNGAASSGVTDSKSGLGLGHLAWAAVALAALGAGYYLGGGREPGQVIQPVKQPSGQTEASAPAGGDISGKPAEGAGGNPAPLKQAPTPPADMVFVKGGCFPMGDNFGDTMIGNRAVTGSSASYKMQGILESPIHKACVEDFFMDKHEMTQKKYLELAMTNNSQFIGCGNCPVESVGWSEANEFCLSQGKRLPSEAEWEYAAREGGKMVRFGTGKNEMSPDDANYNYQDGVKPVPVGSYAPNHLGLYDMAGNVSEWTSDEFISYDTLKPIHKSDGPMGVSMARRGGSWRSKVDAIRASAREWEDTRTRNPEIGFRCVKDTKPKENP